PTRLPRECATLALHSLPTRRSSDLTALATSEIQKIQAAFSTIVGDYVEDVDRDAVVDGAISGMTQVLEDPYSQYLTDQSAQQLDETIDGSFVGFVAEIIEK